MANHNDKQEEGLIQEKEDKIGERQLTNKQTNKDGEETWLKQDQILIDHHLDPQRVKKAKEFAPTWWSSSGFNYYPLLNNNF